MDREQARFILRSFRPDGADATDPDFAEALQFAAADLELAEWFAHERSQDSALATALAASSIPPDLRDEILASLTATRGDRPQAEDRFDAAMIGAMATIQPPLTLRLEAVAAMERTRQTTRLSIWRKAGMPLAAAAGIALALILTRSGEPAPAPLASTSPLPVELVQAGFIQTFTNPFFSVDPSSGHTAGMPVEQLTEQKLPCPKLLPPGLQGLKNIGCRELMIDGKRGSLVCFDTTSSGTVHLVIFRREDVCGELPCQKAPNLSQLGSFAVAKWCDDRHVFMLLGTTEIQRLEALF